MLDVHVGQSDVLTIGHSPGMDMKIATDFPQLDATPGDRYVIGREVTTVQIVPRMSSNPGEIGIVELACITVRGFSQIDSAPDDCDAVELDFRRTSFPSDEFSAGRECDYIRLAPLARSSVCARTVTGSLLFGSPHRLVRSCLCFGG